VKTTHANRIFSQSLMSLKIKYFFIRESKGGVMIFNDEIQRVGDVLGLKGKFCIDWGFDDIIKAAGFDPRSKPQTETVEVKRWVAISNSDGKETLYEGKPSFVGDARFTCFELTGTYEREVNPKVRHREEIDFPRGEAPVFRSVHADSKIPADISNGHFFYRSKNAIKPIQVPSAKTWAAYERWKEQATK